MFKQTYGFDIDIIKVGVPVVIKDSETGQRKGRMFCFDGEEDYNYYFENKSGTYLVRESSSTMLRLTDVNGEIIKMPIKHFIGENPRMKIKVYGE